MRSEREGKHAVTKIFAEAGRSAADQRSYSGTLADAQDHLELIMACACTRAHR